MTHNAMDDLRIAALESRIAKLEKLLEVLHPNVRIGFCTDNCEIHGHKWDIIEPQYKQCTCCNLTIAED